MDILTTVFLIFVAQRSAKSAKKCLCTLYNKISMLTIYLLKITSFLICCIWCCSVIPLFCWYPLVRQCSAVSLYFDCFTAAPLFRQCSAFCRCSTVPSILCVPIVPCSWFCMMSFGSCLLSQILLIFY